MTDQNSFKLLHLSDLHVGMSYQHLLWPNLKDRLLDDLMGLHKRVGPWDAVLFSGDFAQRGLDDEFGEVVARLESIWRHFANLGFQPQLICIPGNHDIQRPDPKMPEVRVLRKWFDERDVWDDFFTSPGSDYRRAITEVFAAYDRFLINLRSTAIPLAKGELGLLSGDQIFRLQVGAISIGIATFNSTWLQLTGDDYKGRLAIDLRQAHILKPELGAWCLGNTFNLVATHHPIDWLHPDSSDTWKREISPPGRFDLHLFGHMHEPFSLAYAADGAAARHSMQAPSLFGMEFLADGRSERIHGYSLLCLELNGTQRSVQVWPRLWLRRDSGDDGFIPNNKFVLEDDRYFRIALQNRSISIHDMAESDKNNTLDAANVEEQSRDVLRPLQYHLAAPRAHLRVRHSEQQQCQGALQKDNAIWLTSEWGLGSDEFLGSVIAQKIRAPKVYRLDASEYVDMDSFSSEIGRKLGCNFAQFCDALNREPSLLIIDDVPNDSGVLPGAVPIETGIEAFVDVVKDACPLTQIVLRTFRRPVGNKLSCIQLAPLDEADVKLYVGDHERGGEKFTAINAISILYKHTDGYPGQLDARLKELALVSIEELSSGDDDLFSTDRRRSDVPPMLQRSVSELATAAEKPLKRMYDLLQALMVFPQGAELSRIKRFNGVNPFHLADAMGLMDRGLITVSEAPEMGGAETSSQKILIVPRPIRDYLRTLASDELLDSLNLRAAKLLFGPDWMAGSKDWPSQLDYSSAKCANADIANASALLVRLFRIYRDEPASREASAVVSLAATFARALTEGVHYTSAANFCRDFLALMGPDDSKEKRANLVRQYGYSLRMLGERDRAKEIFSEIVDFPFTKDIRQFVLIELAQCCKPDRKDEAIGYAEQVLKINRSNSYGYRARYLMVDLEKVSPERTKKLYELEKNARKRGFSTVADNIALTLAQEAKADDEARQLLGKVLVGRNKTADFYNLGRAVLQLVARKMKTGAEISDVEVSQLIICYQFMLNERVPWMFNGCHKALWHVFKQRKSYENLLTLFRYSSMIWRLRGEDQREQEYIPDIKSILDDVSPRLTSRSKVAHYFYARLAHYEGSKSLIGSG